MKKIIGWGVLGLATYKMFQHSTGNIGGAVLIVFLFVALWIGYSKLIDYASRQDPSGVTCNIITILCGVIGALLFLT